MDINSKFPSTFLKAADLKGREVRLQIATPPAGDPVSEEIVRGSDGDERLVVLYFAGTDRGLVLNKTNANALCDVLGGESRQWCGAEVTLFVVQTNYGPGIRIRVSAEQASLEAAPTSPAANGSAPAGNGAPDGVPF